MPSTRTARALSRLASLTPRQIVAELDRYIVGQSEAKKAVAIALRNRWRRQQAPDGIRDEIAPNNIILIGPTGVGKTEIARRLARLAGAPFVKVEASKFTEVGYVGRDVESMVRDLMDNAVALVRREREEEVAAEARQRADERILDILLPNVPEAATEDLYNTPAGFKGTGMKFAGPSPGARDMYPPAGFEDAARQRHSRTRAKIRALLKDGEMEDREVEIEVRGTTPPVADFIGSPDAASKLGDLMDEIMPPKKRRRRLRVAEARRYLISEEMDKLIDSDAVSSDALERVERMGIIFLDEIDKIAGQKSQYGGPDISREGVQRDLLPIVEGSNVQTRHGMVRTDHVLFIAAGAFHVSKPSDLIPELQGRFPIRVELHPLTEADFLRIMVEPENALTRQYTALVEAEGAALSFTDDGIAAIAQTAALANSRMENIGARRLHTVMSTLLEDVLFGLPESGSENVVVDGTMVKDRLRSVVEDEDLRRYIL